MANKAKTNRVTAVDVSNVGHFNYTAGQINTLPKRLNPLSAYQILSKVLSKKAHSKWEARATKSNNYVKTRAKLQRDYRKVANIQHDIMQKFTTQLVEKYDKIVIEDLAVKEMQMTHVASKGLQRSNVWLFQTDIGL